jgi:signal transduction histidine kinase
MVALIAHELRSPLAAISNGLLVCRSGPSPEALAHVHGILDRQIHKALRLVEDLVDLSRPGSVALTEEAPVDLSRVITDAVEELEHQIRAQQQVLTLELPRCAVLVRGDAMRLQQVVVNLLGNGSKYSPSGGHITLSLAFESDQAVLRIRDGGLGISAEDLPHIFESFFRAGRSFDGRQEGLGLGLAIAQRVIELHGGTIEARSDGPNQGSEFTVRLPAIAATTPGDR